MRSDVGYGAAVHLSGRGAQCGHRAAPTAAADPLGGEAWRAARHQVRPGRQTGKTPRGRTKRLETLENIILAIYCNRESHAFFFY